MRFKNVPTKKAAHKEASILRNTLGHEDEESHEEEDDEEQEEAFEDVRIEENEGSFSAERVHASNNR